MAGLRDYFAEHAFSNATFDDLLRALEKASGRDLSDWGAQWLKTTGLNILRPDFQIEPDGTFRNFAVLRKAPVPAPARPGCTASRSASTTTTGHRQAGPDPPRRTGRRGRQHRRSRTGGRAARQADPRQRRRPDVLLAPAGPGLARHPRRPDRRHRRAAPPHPRVVGGVGDDPTGEMRAATSSVSCSAASEPRPRWASSSGSCCGADGARGVRRAGWADAFGWPAFADRLSNWPARPRRLDHQLAFVNALTGSQLSAWHTEILQELLDTTDPATVGLAGLVVDTDLRWRLVHALAAAGRSTPTARRAR